MIVAHSQLVKYRNDLGFDTNVVTDDENVTILRNASLYQELTPSQKPFEAVIRRRKYIIRNRVPPINPGFDDYQVDNAIKQSHDLIEKMEAYYDSYDSIFIERKITIFNKRYTPVGFIYIYVLIEKGKLKEYTKSYSFFDTATTEDVQDKFNLKGHYTNGKLSVLHKYKAVL